MFQSTRPRGARQGQRASRSDEKGFNPRAREGRDLIASMPEHTLPSFNPRAREGRDNPALPSGTVVEIVSIHAPARGATLRSTLVGLIGQSFNPRAREGRDA